MDEELNSKVYIKVDTDGKVLAIEGGYSIGNITDITEWVYIDEGTGDRYNLCQSHYFDKPIYTEDGLHQYRYVDGAIREATEAELRAELDARPEPPKSDHDLLMDLIAEVAELRSYVNSIGKTELVGKGTEADPFEWFDGIELIPNAYYSYGGKKFVWMGRPGISHDAPEDVGGDWVEWFD